MSLNMKFATQIIVFLLGGKIIFIIIQKPEAAFYDPFKAKHHEH